MIAITGATGQLGRLVIGKFEQIAPCEKLVALVRNPAKAADLAKPGLELRAADYNDSGALDKALRGVDKLLLISSSEIGQRFVQHRNVIEAAKRQSVKLIAYTSVLHADTSLLGLAEEHRQTEALLRASGIPLILLRNGWYSENYTASVPAALHLGALYGSAGEGRISSAAREDYAEAAVRALLGVKPGTVLELAGDQSYTLGAFAEELSRQSGRNIPYRDLPEGDYKAALLGAGLPEGLAALLANADAAAAKGALFDDSGTLGKLLGRPTTPLSQVLKRALGAKS